MTAEQAIERSASSGYAVELPAPARDWRTLRDAAAVQNIDHDREVTTYHGTLEDGRSWSVSVYAEQPAEGGFPGHEEDA